ncbi:hypothetical protein [Hyalangium versicolor]|uniref:hypothetical protein n=1 Tax=Hyalangium versicolor TaxID=2861190 RepID=UPI001CCA7A02|nr:hypothetical protein [Hyalangium versicolor]
MTLTDERLAGLALAWLLTRPKRRGSRKELHKALTPIVAHRWSRAEWANRCEALIEDLARDGRVLTHARGGLELTPEGQASGLSLLGVEHLPRGLSWAKLKQTLLLARALGLPPTKQTLARLEDADGVRAALLRQEHQLPLPEAPTLVQARDRLLWKQLGVETEQPFTLNAVQAHLLGKLLESKVAHPELALRQLAARTVKASRPDAEAIRMAALRGWLLPAETEATSTPAPAPAPAPEDSLSAFAERVLAAARASPTGRFGENKVFISHVWKALQPEWGNREAFDQQLLEANRTRRLSLSRADLVEAMNPADVSESEVSAYGASFHFIVL